MPIYDFKCSNEECNHTLEKIVSKFDDDSDPVTVECPKCHSECRVVIPQGSRNKVKFLFNYLAD